jgi:hypothetical protein
MKNIILRIIKRVLGVHNEDSLRYRRVVQGGSIVLAPINISGEFCMPALSHISERIINTGFYEPEVTNILDRLVINEGVIVNIGANIGLLVIRLLL